MKGWEYEELNETRIYRKKNGYINMVDMLSEYGMFPIFRKVLKKEIDTKKIDRIAIKNGYNDTWGMLIECVWCPVSKNHIKIGVITNQNLKYYYERFYRMHEKETIIDRSLFYF